jgi:hypothetical protein
MDRLAWAGSALAQFIGISLFCLPLAPFAAVCFIGFVVSFWIFEDVEEASNSCLWWLMFTVLAFAAQASLIIPFFAFSQLQLDTLDLPEPWFWAVSAWLYVVLIAFMLVIWGALIDSFCSDDEDDDIEVSASHALLGRHRQRFTQLVEILLKRIGSSLQDSQDRGDLGFGELLSVLGYLSLAPSALVGFIVAWVDEDRVELVCVKELSAANCTGLLDSNLCCVFRSVNTDVLAITAYIFSNFTLAVVLVAICIRISLHVFLRKHTAAEAIGALARNATLGRHYTLRPDNPHLLGSTSDASVVDEAPEAMSLDMFQVEQDDEKDEPGYVIPGESLALDMFEINHS